MPSYADDLVVVVEHFNHLHLVLTLRVRYHYALVKASACHEFTICRVRHATHLCRVKLLVIEAFAHLKIPSTNRSVIMTNGAEAAHESVLLRRIRHLVRPLIVVVSRLSMVRAEADLVHLGELGTVHLINKLVASDVPNLDDLVYADRDGKRSVIRRFDRIDVALMAFQVCYILPSLGVPDLDIVFH